MVKMDVVSLSDEWLEAALNTGGFHAHGGKEIAELAADNDVAFVNVGIFADFHFPKQRRKTQILDHFIHECAGLEPIPAELVPLEWNTAWRSWGNVTSCARQADAWLRLRRPSPRAPFKVHAAQAGASSQLRDEHGLQAGPNKRPRPSSYGEGNAAIGMPVGHGPESPASDDAADPTAAAAFAVPRQQEAPPSPPSAMAGSDQHQLTDHDDAAAGDEATASDGVRAGPASPPVGPGAGAADDELLDDAARAAGDIAVVLRRVQAKLRECAATSAALLVDKETLEQDLGRLAAANARLEGEKAALQAALGAQEQRLLAQAEQEREAWQQERSQHEARLQGAHRDHQERIARVKAAVEL